MTPDMLRSIIDQICEKFEIELTIGDRNILAHEMVQFLPRDPNSKPEASGK
jgi:hypothetical protein